MNNSIAWFGALTTPQDNCNTDLQLNIYDLLVGCLLSKYGGNNGAKDWSSRHECNERLWLDSMSNNGQQALMAQQ